MIIPIYLDFNLIILYMELVITISSIYAAWINLVQKRISRIGFDAVILLFFNKRKAAMIRKDPRLITQMGLITLLVAVGGLNEVLPTLVQNIQTFIH